MAENEAAGTVSVVMQEGSATTETMTKHMVTTTQTTHMETSQQSAVHVETSSFSSQGAIEAASTGTIPPEEPSTQPTSEASVLDENANSIPEESPVEQVVQVQESQAETEAIPEPPTEPELITEPEPVTEPEPATEPETEAIPEPVTEPEPAAEPEATAAPAEPEAPATIEREAPSKESAEISQENIKTQLHEIICEIEKEVLPEQEEEVQKEEEEEEMEEKEGGDGTEKDIQPVEEAKPVKEEEKGENEEKVEEAKPVIKEEEVTLTDEVKVIEDQYQTPAGDEEVEVEEYEYYDEEGTLHHTWRPKGKYHIEKTTVNYEDVIPIQVPDVQFTEIEPQPIPPQPQSQPQQQQEPQTTVIPEGVEGMTNGSISPGLLSPIDIPEGIPLLARVLPKVDHSEDGEHIKISLERLFTPATDSGDLTPKKNLSKKAFASSAFYRPDHPTIDDQVELAQRISFSLVDENNKMSRGQSMYMKRKKRSMRWIHQGPGSGYDTLDDDSSQRPPDRRPVSMPPLLSDAAEKPNMKLLMSPKGVQDFQAVHEHYQSLLSTSTGGGNSPDIGKIATEVQSPSGKGAELFAKRKKRMDKFIVDETTVQKAQQSSSSSTLTQQQSMSSSSSTSAEFSSQSLSSSSSFVSKKQMEAQRNQQQDQILISAPPMGGPAPLAPPLATGTGPMYTAEVKVVQRASLPPTPVDMPHHSLLDMIEQEKSEKRRSLSFNMAAKGWGTYNRFYTPVTFAT